MAAVVDMEQEPLTREAALQAAAAEGLVLLPAGSDSSTPYRHVYKVGKGPRCFLARVHAGGKKHPLGCFHTAEEAALVVARTLPGLKSQATATGAG